MRTKFLFLFCLFVGPFMGTEGVRAQKMGSDPTVSLFNPLTFFVNDFYPQRGDLFCSPQGEPGPSYWQNRVDYGISCAIDTANNILSATEVLSYWNNSPFSLDYLWLQLDQNTYRVDARSNYYNGLVPEGHTSGYEIQSVEIEVPGFAHAAKYRISDTRMQIWLDQPLPAKGKVRLSIKYTYHIPGAFGNRTGFSRVKGGTLYEIAQWFPRMCVFDDQVGWNTLPFLGSGEFYCEYGDIDYKVTVPSSFLVAGSGELVNPGEVLTASQIRRLQKAKTSDETVSIRALGEVNDPASRPAKTAVLTWHFLMKNTRDVAFGASKAYAWDAARINLPRGKKSMAMSFYPVESGGNLAWGRATAYLKKNVEYFSAKWYPYPYPVAVNLAGNCGGMEYPGILFDGMNDTGKTLFWVTAHEIGHNWFPMIVGSDERKYAWMDEGLNTFIDVYASDVFNKGEYAPKRDVEYAQGGGHPADEIVPITDDRAAPTIMTQADLIPEKYRHELAYFKPAFGLILLREQILDTARFDAAFKNYIKKWAFKHPAPQDFFRCMENGAGENLSWFWNGWFYHNWKFDVAVGDIKYVENDPQKGADVYLNNLGKMAFPVALKASFDDGSALIVPIPIETFYQGAHSSFRIPSNKKICRIILDPDHALPDANRSNNEKIF